MRFQDLVDFYVLFVWYLMTPMLVLHALRSEGEGDKIMEEVMGFGTYIVFMLLLWNFDSYNEAVVFISFSFHLFVLLVSKSIFGLL